MVNYENTLTLHGSRDKKSPSHRWRGFLTSPIYTASVGTVCNFASEKGGIQWFLKSLQIRTSDDIFTVFIANREINRCRERR